MAIGLVWVGVHLLIIWTEAETIALNKAIGDTPYLTCGGFEAVDLAGQERGGAEGLFEAVGWTDGIRLA